MIHANAFLYIEKSRKIFIGSFIFFLFINTLFSGIYAGRQTVFAQESRAPFQKSLLRLTEILGSLHYLRNLCSQKSETNWRHFAEELIKSSKWNSSIETEFYARFNSGYNGFETVYRTCTPSARTAIVRFMKEADTITEEIQLKYSEKSK